MKNLAIERMKFLSMTGKEENLDFIIANDLIGSGFQPENALKVLEKGWKLTYFSYDSRIKEYIKKAENLLKKLDIHYEEKPVELTQNFDALKQCIETSESKINNVYLEIEEKEKEIEELNTSILPIEHLKNFPETLENLYNLRYMSFRFGVFSLENYDELCKELEHIDAILLELDKTEDEVWVVYFTPKALSEKVDSYFKVMKFKRIWLPEDFKGMPSEVITQVKTYIKENQTQIENQKIKLSEMRETIGRELINALLQLQLLEKINKVKKYMAHDNKGSFYIVGWIPYHNLEALTTKLKNHQVEYIVKSHDEVASIPPTKLKNNKIIKPFESIVKMYGTPNYTEMDPTFFVAITAFLMFGFMFGDVGQGLLIALIGLILIKKKKSLGPIFTAAGISAILFGFLYGSVLEKKILSKVLYQVQWIIYKIC